MSGLIERWSAAERAVEVPFRLRGADIVMLGEAQLCQDCEAISRAPLGVCDRCGSAALLDLGNLLRGRRHHARIPSAD